MKKYIKLNDNDNHLSWGNFTRIVKEYTVNKSSALQVEIFCTVFDTHLVGDTTVNNYCTGIRSINDEYKQKFLIYKKKYTNNKNILVNTVINLLSIIDGNIYNYNNDDIAAIQFINSNDNLKNICLKLYNISKNDSSVNNNLSNILNKLINDNDLYDAIVNILFFIILEKKQPIYEENVKKNVIENLLNNTDISSLELEEYLNLKFTDGINYNFSLNKLAKENNAYALYEMGTDEYYGYIKGYPRYDVSFDYFRRASYKNHPGSFYMMAKLYINGFVGSKSNDELKEAFKYLNTAIEYGNVAAINTMGLLYLNGTYPVKKDINTAIEFFEKASSKDYPYAYNNLGLIYEAKGDMKKAFEFFEKSSLLDESWALNKIGEFYRNGIYVKKDMKKAFDYYNKAIEAPISTVSYYAFYNLAKYYYLTGNTVLIKDEDKAIKYLDIASSHAIEAAILLLYLYTEKYLNKKDDDLYDKIKLLISRIENNPKYNESIKSIIEDNLKKLKENRHINIDILN